MAVEIGTATGYIDLMHKFRRFITGRGTVASNVYSGVGNGVMSGVLLSPDAVTETWTFTCTAAAADSATFSPVGSVSGVAADITTGVEYSNFAIDSLLISDGSTDFQVGDEWVISVVIGAMSSAGQAWYEERFAPAFPDIVGGQVDDLALYLRGPGLAGDDAIHVQLYTYHNDVSDIYNWQINGAAGFDPASTPMYTDQPGYDGGGVAAMMLWEQLTPYWFIANGRRFIIVAKVSTVYQTCYGGFILPYGLPSEYPYPLMIGGSYNGVTRWSATDPGHLNFTNPNHTLRLRQVDGNWLSFENYYDQSNVPARRLDSNVWPTAAMPIPRPSPDGTYTLGPLVLHTNQQGGNVYGEFQGVFRVSGYANASENILSVGGVDHLVVQDGFRTGAGNYFAVALE